MSKLNPPTSEEKDNSGNALKKAWNRVKNEVTGGKSSSAKADQKAAEAAAENLKKQKEAVAAFQSGWNDVKEGVIKGTSQPEELQKAAKTLLSLHAAAGQGANAVMNNIIKDCKDAGISDDNLHKFVGAALNAELNVEKAKGKSSTGIMRDNSTIAGPLLKYEVEKRGFEPGLFDTVKNGSDKQVIDAFIDIKIPPYLKDHYSPIIQHYQETGGKEGVQSALTNLVFSNLYPTLQASNRADYNKLKDELGLNDPRTKAEGVEMGKTTTRMADLSHAAYPTKGDEKLVKTGEEGRKAFAKEGMFAALEKQFDPDPSKQQLSSQEMQQLKEKAYLRDTIYKEDKKAQAAMSQQPPEKTNVPPKETKVEIASKSFADRFHEVKNQTVDRLNKVETQVRTVAKSVEISATRLANNIKEGKLDVNQLKTDLGKVKEAHQFTAENAKTLAKKLTGQAIEQIGSKGNEVTSKLGKDINTGINTSSISSPVAKRAADIIKDSLVHPHQQQTSPGAGAHPEHPPAQKKWQPAKHGSGHEGR